MDSLPAQHLDLLLTHGWVSRALTIWACWYHRARAFCLFVVMWFYTNQIYAQEKGLQECRRAHTGCSVHKLVSKKVISPRWPDGEDINLRVTADPPGSFDSTIWMMPRSTQKTWTKHLEHLQNMFVIYTWPKQRTWATRVPLRLHEKMTETVQVFPQATTRPHIFCWVNTCNACLLLDLMRNGQGGKILCNPAVPSATHVPFLVLYVLTANWFSARKSG